MQNTTNIQAPAFGHGGWKYYNSIKKKAMEQEFSWSGLIISLSIAFFIVIACAMILNFTYESMAGAKEQGRVLEQRIYYLEDINHINTQTLDTDKLPKINLAKLNLV
jgi:hypothetical protein